jgi:aminomethyltransferase
MGAQPATTEALRRTPLFEAARSAGGRMVPFAGWEMAVQFSGLLQEHKAVREHCGLFDISHMGVLRLSGAGAKDALQGLVPTDLFRIGPGEACYTVLLNEQGCILDDLIVYDRGWNEAAQVHELLLVINAACSASNTAWIRSQLEPAGIQVEDHKGKGVLVALQGPEAASQLERLSGTCLKGLARFGHRQLDLPGIGEAFVARTGYTGEDGFELLLDEQAGLSFWNQCLAEGITPCGLGARDTLRLEAGMLLYGSDMDAATTPLEAGLGWLVHLEMPKPFVGRQILEQQSKVGVKRRLVGVKLSSKAIPRAGYSLFLREDDAGNEPIGQVSSGGWSPTLNAGIALAHVATNAAKIGTELEVEIRGKRVPAIVTRKQFINSTLN